MNSAVMRLVTVLSPGVRLIWKDFLHSKKQQDLIIVRDPLQRVVRLFKERLSTGAFKKTELHEASVKKNLRRNTAFKGRQIA